jgi:hypothetical protein
MGMADNGHIEADSEATKWFRLAVIGTVLYVSAVFAFVINGDLSDQQEEPLRMQAQQETEHGQPH